VDVAALREHLHQAICALSVNIQPGEDVLVQDLQVPASAAAPAVPLRVYTPRQRKSDRVLLWIHGGGFFAGHHEDEGFVAIPWVRQIGCTVVSVGYRRPPEAQHPAAIDDCYAALQWLAASPCPLGFEPGKIAVGGISAGGCLAAATALKARDSGGPKLCFQLLLVPALDNRSSTPSMLELQDSRCWNRSSNLAAWAMYVGAGSGGDVSPYAAPARAKDLAGLPPVYMEVAEMDPLRDEAIEYASRLMRAGVPTELHVFPGAYHGSTYFQAAAGISRRAAAESLAALQRALV
jgi:acetyl esterase/lipase